MFFSFDILVIGAGHAGCEAARAAALRGAQVCLITMDMEKIAQMSCNPAIGGIAKGQIVREIDALGGMTGQITDRTAIQFRMLNLSKGPAMWSPRAQCDRQRFSAEWRRVLENTDNLTLWQDQAVELLVEDGKAVGVKTLWGNEFRAKCVIVTAGTFLNGLMHLGRVKVPGGRISEPASLHFSESIAKHGISVARMKTGTPMRLDSRTIDFSRLTRQDGDSGWHRFSFVSKPRQLPQIPCWICNTNEAAHAVLRSGLSDSPLYNGQIQSIGPRYCPSIETKLHTFPDRDHHPLFLEPEGVDTNMLYLNGFSSSLPLEIQLESVRRIPGFENAQIFRPGYAIEYDFFDPTELENTLESKKIEGLFLAGQVNGTTGYEEAAGQGLVAGINASLKLEGKEPFVMKRDESYIGVLIDDLTTKGVDEPYRMFTSRAEYRILLRQDNADARLTAYGHSLGLIDNQRYTDFCRKQDDIAHIVNLCSNYVVKPGELDSSLASVGSNPVSAACKLSTVISRPDVTLASVAAEVPPLSEAISKVSIAKDEVLESAEIAIKYEGYIRREQQEAQKMHRLEAIRIRGCFDYAGITQISTEGRQKLVKFNPETLGQASRIPGVSPSDINVLLVLMHR
jgi:tRNA uridine 5-carboxymethylaminomethyl modification enzyme